MPVLLHPLMVLSVGAVRKDNDEDTLNLNLKLELEFKASLSFSCFKKYHASPAQCLKLESEFYGNLKWAEPTF